jgi:hypothetical protein|tara:strand:- start:85 stop:261 length:177 start_codon:yes stop_codon:yes gene_type:complete
LTFFKVQFSFLDFGVDIYDEEESPRDDVTFRWYGRVEGGMFIDVDDYEALSMNIMELV